ncbi:MAG TPA: TerC family protein, partial [Thermomicrobiales bacterium]|nr:TerC family protein [Thermomicrobiales bacterium]
NAARPGSERASAVRGAARGVVSLVLELIGAVLSIVVIDLVLSGDNAVVIGMAARQLSSENRRRAIVLGGGGAIVLRIAFTAMAAILLDIPYLRFVGGVLLLWIAWKLVRPADHEEKVSEAESLGVAVRTIVLADVVMSLDNILAVGGAAHGQIEMLIFGLLLSIPIILVGSELVARLLGRVPALLYLGVFVLVHTAVSMLLEDPLLHQFHTATLWEIWATAAVVTLIISAFGRKAQRRQTEQQAVLPSRAPTADRTADRAA